MIKISAPPRLRVNPLLCHSRAGGNPWPDFSEIGFARRHKDTKKVLRVLMSLCEPKSSHVWKHQTIDPRLRGDDNIGLRLSIPKPGPTPCHSRAGGNPWRDFSEIGFAQRHEGTKKLLRVLVSLCEPKSSHVGKHQPLAPSCLFRADVKL